MPTTATSTRTEDTASALKTEQSAPAMSTRMPYHGARSSELRDTPHVGRNAWRSPTVTLLGSKAADIGSDEEPEVSTSFS